MDFVTVNLIPRDFCPTVSFRQVEVSDLKHTSSKIVNVTVSDLCTVKKGVNNKPFHPIPKVPGSHSKSSLICSVSTPLKDNFTVLRTVVKRPRVSVSV